MAQSNKTVGYTQVLTKSISHVTATPVQNLGDRCVYDGDEYVYVYAKTVTCPIGYAVQLSASTDYSVTISATTDANYPIGIVKHVDIEKSEYGWIVTRGRAPAVPGLNTTLDALDRIIMVSTTNTGNITRVKASTVYSQVVEPKYFGIVLVAGETAGSGGNAEVYINC